jgi:hypothetical protein
LRITLGDSGDIADALEKSSRGSLHPAEEVLAKSLRITLDDMVDALEK